MSDTGRQTNPDLGEFCCHSVLSIGRMPSGESKIQDLKVASS